MESQGSYGNPYQSTMGVVESFMKHEVCFLTDCSMAKKTIFDQHLGRNPKIGVYTPKMDGENNGKPENPIFQWMTWGEIRKKKPFGRRCCTFSKHPTSKSKHINQLGWSRTSNPSTINHYQHPLKQKNTTHPISWGF